MPVELSPVQNTFRVGDSIKVRSEFDFNVYEEKTSRSYILKNFEFYPEVAINKLDTANVDHNAARFFTLQVDTGIDFEPYVFNSTQAYRFLGEYTYSDNQYILHFTIIPQKPGLYLFDITSFLYPQNEDQDFEGRCRNKSSEAFMSLNNGDAETNNHGLLMNTIDTSFVEEVLKEYDLSGSFLFYVED